MTGNSATRLLIVTGPTGTGKTATAIRVAEQLGGEIVGCDALQVYLGFDAATAKPSAAEQARVRHHLVDVADPRKDFSLADYVRLAEQAVADIAGRGRVPLVVGGTGMYLRGLLRGIVPAPARDEALRARLKRMVERYGSARLHRVLARLDPGSAARVMPGDTQRIIRALEIGFAGDGTWSEVIARQGTWSHAEDRFPSLKIGLDGAREEMNRRLDRRVDGFYAAGLVEEVRGLLDSGVPATANAFKAIGYREVLRALDQGEDPAGVIEEIQRNTRRFAKRQRTWFRKEPALQWLDADAGADVLTERIVTLWNDCS